MSEPFGTAVENLTLATAAEKCRACGCFASSVAAIGRICGDEAPAPLAAALAAARDRIKPTRYDCLGCEVCWPAIALNAAADPAGVEVEGDACPIEPLDVRSGWPPLSGSYQVLRYQAPVAVCTLHDDALADAVAAGAGSEVSIVGTMRTENLGIERLISNVVANPHLRFLVLAGSDARQVIGHLPGRSLLALGVTGIDARGRIVGAPGKRPLIRNVPFALVEHFRRTVEIVDLIGETEPARVLRAASDCAARDPGPAEAPDSVPRVSVTAGWLPDRMVSDPAGYFVVYAVPERPLLSLEHYRNDGVLDHVIEGRTSAELYIAAVGNGLVSRLDHAAYLGRELARAEMARDRGERYVQDGAPELPAERCGCDGSCGEGGVSAGRLGQG